MDHLQTEARNPASTNLDELTPLELVLLLNSEDSRVISAVASQAGVIARAIEVIADRLRAGGRLVYAGAGTSGRLGVLDATECPPTFSSPPGQVVGLIAGGPTALTQAVEGAEDRPELAEQDLRVLGLGSQDVLVGIATSGRTPYVLGAMSYARKQGAYTVSLSCNPQSDLEPLSDLAITPVVGPEVLSGSTRLKAGTATKLVLNMLSTGAMVRLGKTYGNLMVDLRATNSKLRARANRIVRTLTGLSVGGADDLLQECGGELKTALVAYLANVAPEEARARLQGAGGLVRKALAQSNLSPRRRPARNEVDRLYLGIDGGGTHTVALLASRERTAESLTVRCGHGSLLGRGEAGSSNLHAVGPARAFAALEEAIAGAFAAAKLPREPVAVACLGLAGAGRTEERDWVLNWARRVNLARDVEVTTDAALLLAAGTRGWGLAVVAGTGSIAYGRTVDGRVARAGGWGYLLGDEGSGYALVLAALRAVARAADQRGPDTHLTQLFLAKLGAEQAQELIRVVYQGGWDRAKLAGLVPLVFEAAEAGDAVAETIVAEAGGELACTAETVVRKLGLDEKPLDVALAGGVLLRSAHYRKRFFHELDSLGVCADRVTLVPEPAAGAVRLALRRIYIRQGDIHLTNLRTRMPFKYGIATMTSTPHAFVRLEVEIDGKRSSGIAADSLPPRWFTKDPSKPLDAEVAEMLRVIEHALQTATGLRAQSPFDAWQELYHAQAYWGRGERLPPLLSNFGTSLVERALIDAVCRAERQPFAQMLRTNQLGIRLGELHSPLLEFAPADFLPERPLTQLMLRHTVGLADPLVDADIPPAERLDDGLPQSLAACIRAYGLRHFKIKVSGVLDSDRQRLRQLAQVVEENSVADYAFSLDGNEQFHALAEFRIYWEELLSTDPLRSFFQHLLFVEQPLHRDVALQAAAVGALRDWPERPLIIIDESDGELQSLSQALALGYAGASHKNCKGVFKGIGHACLLAQRRRREPEQPSILSGEDLVNIGPVALLQDLTVCACLDIASVERNGHHYFAGLSMFPREVQEQVLKAHGDLYHAGPLAWPTLTIKDGSIQLDSVLAAAFGVGWELNVEQFTPLASWQPSTGS